MSNKPTDEEVKKAILVILDDKKAYDTSLAYAIGYCQNALSMFGHDLKVQCLYILNNISHWHGEGSKDVRNILKSFTK